MAEPMVHLARFLPRKMSRKAAFMERITSGPGEVVFVLLDRIVTTNRVCPAKEFQYIDAITYQ